MSEIFGYPIISGKISAEPTIKGSISNNVEKTYYDGEYEVTPRLQAQTLETADKTMRKDITIKEVPVSETTNPDGGTTIVIAYEE